MSTLALRADYRRWCDAAGAQDMPALGYQMSGRRLASQGYIHEAH